MIYKRYQYWGPHGIQWTKWFPYRGQKKPKYQLGKLLNEYNEKRIQKVQST